MESEGAREQWILRVSKSEVECWECNEKCHYKLRDNVKIVKILIREEKRQNKIAMKIVMLRRTLYRVCFLCLARKESRCSTGWCMYLGFRFFISLFAL